MPDQNAVRIPKAAAPAQTAAPARMLPVCEAVASPTRAAAYRDAWAALSAACVDANPFCQPWSVLPAMMAFPETGAEIVFVRDPPEQGGALIAVVPVVFQTHLRGLPFAHLKLWVHQHCFMAAPLIRRGRALDVWQALCVWARRRGAQILDLQLMPADHDACQGLTGTGAVCVSQFDRAVFRPHPEGAQAYLSAATSSKARKQWRRLLRQLEAQGEVRFETLGSGQPAHGWIEAFLALEASGWKGRDGSAMASRPAEAQFFRDMLEGAQEAGALHMMRLTLNGRAIAMQCNLFCGAQGFAFKVAYSEDFAAQSPGVLLERAAIEAFSQRADLRFVDSCTLADSALMRRLWMDSMQVQRLFVPTGRLAGAALCAGLRMRAGR